VQHREFTMFLSRQLVGGLILGLMLLLIAGSSPAYLVDDDGDDELPAVAIELSAALPTKKALHLPERQADGAKAGFIEPRKQSASLSAPIARDHETTALPLVVPLRT
jgi:hypothetical protein